MPRPMTARCMHCGKSCPHCHPRRPPEGRDAPAPPTPPVPVPVPPPSPAPEATVRGWLCGHCGARLTRGEFARHYAGCGGAGWLLPAGLGEEDAHHG